MSIVKCPDFNISIDYLQNPARTVIYSYERVCLQAEEKKLIKLPYFRNNFDKSLRFEIDKKLAQNGILSNWSNINNSESAASCFEILLYNTNIIHSYERNDLTAIIGSGKKVDILSGSVIGTIYE